MHWYSAEYRQALTRDNKVAVVYLLNIKQKENMKINLDKYDASIRDNIATFYVPVNAEKGTELSQENANTEYKVEVIFDEVDKTKVKHIWLVDRNKLGY